MSAPMQQLLLAMQGAIVYVSSFLDSGGTDSSGWIGFTSVNNFTTNSTTSSSTAAHTRITWKAGTSAGIKIDNAYVGVQGGANAYSFSTGSTPTQVTFNGGSAGTSCAANGTIISDTISFNWVRGNSNCVATGYNSGVSTSLLTDSGANAGVNSYFLNASDAATVGKSGYTSGAANAAIGIKQIEVG